MVFAFWKEEPLCLIVEVLWGMSEPHLHLFDMFTIFPKLVFMNSLLHWMKEVKFGWPNLDFVVDGQNSPIQFYDDFSCTHTGLQPCILYKRRTSCIFCYILLLNPSAWGLLKPSSYCDVGRFFYRVFKFGAKLCRSLFKIM